MLPLQLIEIAINKALTYNSASTTDIPKLEGTQFKVNIELPAKPTLVEAAESLLSLPALTSDNQLAFMLCFESGQVVITQDISAAVDVSISGNPPAIVRWLMGSESTSGITVNGELSTLQAIQTWLTRLDIDWEDLIADSIGDTPVATAKMAKQELQRLFNVVRNNS